MFDVNSVRWGDSQHFSVINGQSIRTRELARVKAPYPTTWRVLVGASMPLNGGVRLVLNLALGVGSVMFSGLRIDVATNALSSFEVPGQFLSGTLETVGGAVVADEWDFGLLIAPNAPDIPWTT